MRYPSFAATPTFPFTSRELFGLAMPMPSAPVEVNVLVAVPPKNACVADSCVDDAPAPNFWSDVNVCTWLRYATLLKVPAVLIFAPLSWSAVVPLMVGEVTDVPTVMAEENEGLPLFAVRTVFAPPCAVTPSAPAPWPKMTPPLVNEFAPVPPKNVESVEEAETVPLIACSGPVSEPTERFA